MGPGNLENQQSHLHQKLLANPGNLELPGNLEVLENQRLYYQEGLAILGIPEGLAPQFLLKLYFLNRRRKTHYQFVESADT
jgi:hypothetical protein